MEVLVFKTDVSSRHRVNALAPQLQKLEGIVRWNIDLHDIDNVLRVETTTASPKTIQTVLQQAGHYCEELMD